MNAGKIEKAVSRGLSSILYRDGSRRRFLKLAGLGGLGLAVAPGADVLGAAPAPLPSAPRTGSKPSSHEQHLRRAIALAKQVPEFPFGAVIVQRATGAIVAEGHNRSSESPTFHGEIVVINRCATDYPFIDWAELDLYTTAEPCPMCQSAIEWAGIPTVYYGTSIPYLKRLGWSQIEIRAEEVARRTPFRQSTVIGGILSQECNALFAAAPKSKYRQ